MPLGRMALAIPLMYVVTKAFIHFRSNPTIYEIKVTENVADFPDLTVCNNNPIKASAIFGDPADNGAEDGNSGNNGKTDPLLMVYDGLYNHTPHVEGWMKNYANWNFIRNYCERQHDEAHIVVITEEPLNIILTDTLAEIDIDAAVIGFVRHSGQWAWYNGNETTVDHIQSGTGDCSVLGRDGSWKPVDCETGHPFMCMAPSHLGLYRSCPSGYQWMSYDGFCYRIDTEHPDNSTMVDATEVEEQCLMNYGHLPFYVSVSELNHIVDAKSAGYWMSPWNDGIQWNRLYNGRNRQFYTGGQFASAGFCRFHEDASALGGYASSLDICTFGLTPQVTMGSVSQGMVCPNRGLPYNNTCVYTNIQVYLDGHTDTYATNTDCGPLGTKTTHNKLGVYPVFCQTGVSFILCNPGRA